MSHIDRQPDISRRGWILGTASAFATAASNPFGSKQVCVAADPTAPKVLRHPTSPNAKIIPWGEELGGEGARPRIPRSDDAQVVPWRRNGSGDRRSAEHARHIEFVCKTLFLEGDWSGTRLLEGCAWGNGHDGTDEWSSEGQGDGHRPYFLDFTGLLRHPQWPAFYFTVKLEVADSESAQIAGIFRFTQRQRQNGVFAVSFQFPSQMGLVGVRE